MSKRDIYTLFTRIPSLLIRSLSSIFDVPWRISLVIFRVCNHLPHIIFHQSQPVKNSNSHQPVKSSELVKLNHENLKPYEYEPLPGDRYIRLLLAKGYGGNGGGIEYELQFMNLDNPLTQHMYRAISYTWEGQLPDRFIECSGKKLAITQNCEAILRLVQRLPKNSMPIWIDAICINQSSKDEKEIQVPLMGEIYTRAYEVNIWLGEHTEGTSIVFSYLWLLWCCTSFPKPASTWLESCVHNFIIGMFLTPLLSITSVDSLKPANTTYIFMNSSAGNGGVGYGQFKKL